MTPRVTVTMLFARRLAFVCLTGFVLAACDAAPPSAEPPSGELPCAGATADGTWEALSPPDFWVSRLRIHGDHLFALASRTSLSRREVWRRALRDPDAVWDSLGPGAAQGIQAALDVLADPEDPDRMLVAAEPTNFTGEDRPSVFRTSNGGQTWEDVSDGDEFIARPGFRRAMRRLYGERDGEEAGTVLAVTGVQAYRTHDWGETWEAVVDSASAASPVSGGGFTPVERHPVFPEVLWTGFQTNTFQAVVTRSADGARTWEDANTCPPTCSDAYPADFGFDAADERVAYAALTGAGTLLRTDDLGVTWTNVDGFVGDARSLVGHPEQSGRLWVGAHVRSVDPMQLFVTEDAGQTWTELEVSEAVDEEAFVRDLLWEVEEEAILFGTTRGVYRYRPGLTTELECN